MSYNAKIILDSINPSGSRLTTMAVTFPRFILAEMNTHRMFSRNSASSRAIPISKMIERVKTNPVFPLEWGANKPGMQAGEQLSDYEAGIAAEYWEEARQHAMSCAAELATRGVHKQIVNRILEPFLWHTAIISSTEWQNFFDQRCSPLAQPEMRHTAELMRAALGGSTPTQVTFGEWHLPYITTNEHYRVEYLIKLSIARCARVSYLNHDGTHDPTKDLELYNKLVSADPPHLSPFEHVATPSLSWNYIKNFRGWTQYRTVIENEKAALTQKESA